MPENAKRPAKLEPVRPVAPDVLIDGLWIPVPGDGYPGPLPKGSMRPVGNRYGGKVHLVEQVDGATSWLNHQANEITRAIRVPCDRGHNERGMHVDPPYSARACPKYRLPIWAPCAGPISVVALFLFSRPDDATDLDFPIGREGDTDKLCRSLGDALTKSGLIRDDRQITAWEARKRFVIRADGSRWTARGVDVPGVFVMVGRDVL